MARQRADLELAQPLMQAPQDSCNSSHCVHKAPLLASGMGLQISGKDSLSTGAWRLEEARNRVTRRVFINVGAVHDGLLYHSQLTTTASAIHPEVAIQPSEEVAQLGRYPPLKAT